ncbi:hypothetical protein HPP92_012238 [Vanilla planifolia]|uniref:Cytochrome P450 n=1 Tax=Vanilla planifolia TaxID=51239 RepID=A0A835R4I9_VANPL|nr:hypothetical protein HPP92_012238 [Vanilla planifolia]
MNDQKGGNDIVFGRNDEFWRKMRRLCANHILISKRVRSHQAIRHNEISRLVRSIAACPSGSFINLSEELLNLSNNITAFSKLDFCRLKLDRVADKILREHKAKLGSKASNDEVEDLTDALLKIQDVGTLPFPLSDNHIKAVVNDTMFAGSESSSRAMKWAMSELVRHPAAMKKVHREVRKAFNDGVEQKEESLLRGKLTYLQKVVKETLRLHPPSKCVLTKLQSQQTISKLG